MIDDPEEIARQAIATGRSLRLQIKKITGAHHLATTIFYGADGKISEAATEWLEALGAKCFADEPAYDQDARAHAFNEGRRAVYLEILHGLELDRRRLGLLSRQLRENEDGFE